MNERPHLKGSLHDLSFHRLLLMLSEQQETGVLRVRCSQIEKLIYLKEGRIIFARTTDPDERLGEFLLTHGRITCRQLADCYDQVSPKVRLGTLLVRKGFLTPELLTQEILQQIQEILYDVFTWTGGEFEFFSGTLPGEETITLEVSVPDLIVNGMLRIRRWSVIKKGSVSLEAVFRKSESWASAAAGLTLSPAVKFMIELLDRPRTLAEILELSDESNMKTCQILWAFLTLGIAEQILTERKIEDAEPTVSIAALASPDAEITGPVLVMPEMTNDAGNQSTMPEGAVSVDAIPFGVSHPSIPPPSIDFSFSDLAELTDPLIPEPSSSPAPAMEEWEGNIRQEIKKFNERHRYLIEMLRMELGEQVEDGLLKILRNSSSRFPLVFDGVRLNEFGELNEHTLVSNISGNLVERYKDAFEFLLKEERNMMRSVVDPKRAEAAEVGLQRIVDRQEKAH